MIELRIAMLASDSCFTRRHSDMLVALQRSDNSARVELAICKHTCMFLALYWANPTKAKTAANGVTEMPPALSHETVRERGRFVLEGRHLIGSHGAGGMGWATGSTLEVLSTSTLNTSSIARAGIQ